MHCIALRNEDPFAFASSAMQLRARDMAMLQLDNIWYVGTWHVGCEAACVYSRYYMRKQRIWEVV